MAVLIEAISVVVRLGAIFERFPKAWESFKAAVPNGTLCSDNELTGTDVYVGRTSTSPLPEK
jgi:hypothetical protein